MTRGTNKQSVADTTVAFAEMVERLALAACGAKLWPNHHAREYHRAAVRRMLHQITPADLKLIRIAIDER